MKVAWPDLFVLKLGLLLYGLVFVGTGLANEAFCFNAGAENAWDCQLVDQAETPLDREYHTLKIVLANDEDSALLDKVLPIERIAEVPLPSGETVVFLGRFRDSMKAFRVVQKCAEAHAVACGQFAPEVIKIGAKRKSNDAGDKRVQLASLDLQTKAASDLIRVKTASLDLSEEMLGKAIYSSIGSLNPKGLLKLPETLEHVLWVDVREGDLHVLQRDKGHFKLIETMSISIGKRGYGKVRRGDKKTPVGVYRLLEYLPDERLDDFYGSGAYTLNYPNSLDRIKKRDGSGIWLHGLPKGKDYRPLKDSDGCVVLSNAMIDHLQRYVDLRHTPIVLDDQLEWVASDEIVSRRDELQRTIESWRGAWSAMDNDDYLGYYAADFTNLNKDLTAWKRYKRRIHESKEYIKVDISKLSLLEYPGEQDTVMARFYQRYESSNFNATGWKEQLWRKEDSGQWRIVFERG